jgi:beta-galactosidase
MPWRLRNDCVLTVLLFAAACGNGSSSSKDGGPPATSEPRQAYNGARGRSFDDGWKFHLGDAPNLEQPGFDDSTWRSLSLPHDWSIELGFDKDSPGGGGSGFVDGGTGWYRKTFTLDGSYSGKRILVDFDGVYMNGQVWINGTSLGSRPYGYSTFEYDMTPYVKFGAPNVIAVRANNNQPNSRWYSGSGIYRNVWLTVLEPVHIAFSGAFITTPTVSATSATVSVATEVENQSSSSQSVKARTTIYDASGTQVAGDTSDASDVAAADGKATITQSSLTVATPNLWSIDSPYLYQVKVELLVGDKTVDTYLSSLGLRWTTFDPATGFYLNDQPMKIWGVCNHHDLGALGSAVNVRAIERQLQILKTMGSNAIRTSHNPPAPELLDLADRMGVLIMDEAFDVWENGKVANDYHLYFSQWAERDIQDFVRRDRNHPSVIMWSIGNEISGPSVATATKLRDWVKALDSTRPVTWASNAMANANGVEQQVANILDLQGYNYFGGYKPGDSTFDIDRDHAAHPTWSIFGSEECSDVRSRGIYSSQPDQNLHSLGCDWTAKQCSSYDIGWSDGVTTSEMYLINVSRPYFFGQFDWTGFDYGGEPTPFYNSWPAKSSYFGIIDTAGFPKDIYYFYQSRLTSAPMVHILPHWNWTAGTTVTVWVYSNCDSVELFLNDVSQGAKTFDAGATTRLEWSLPWAPGTLRAEGSRGGAVVASEEVTTAGPAAQVNLTVDRATIRADGRDVAFITADVEDAAGVFAPTASNSITFAVTGPGRIAGVDNGNPIDVTAYTSPTRATFNGKALAIVQSTGQAGPISVSATSSGLDAGSVSVTAQ